MFSAVFAAFLLAFSFALYIDFSGSIQKDIASDISDPSLRQAAAARASDRLTDSIQAVDTASFLVFAVLSFYVAGEALRPFQLSLELQQEFMADASHELRTPLAVLRTGFEVFQRKSAPGIGEAAKLVGDALEEVGRMERLVNDLRTLSRLDSGLQAAREPVDVAEAVLRSCGSLRQYAAARGIALEVDISAKPIAMADPYHLEQAVTNLVKNAVDYSGEGSLVEIGVRGARGALVTVTDHGMGISKSDLPRVFERFFRADQSRSRKTGGSGLGLAIAKDLIERYGGTVAVGSELGRGTEAVISLPPMRRA